LAPIAEEGVEKAGPVMQAIEMSLAADWEALLQAVDGTHQAIDSGTDTANAIVATDLPEAVGRLEPLPAQLDAAVDPARADLVSAFQSLKDDGFALLAGAVQPAATAFERAAEGDTPLQSFLELPGELHELASGHASDQGQEVDAIDLRTEALATANEATHGAAETEARTWGETCVAAMESHCTSQVGPVQAVYESWEQTAGTQGTEVDQAVESAGRRLTDALDVEDENVDRETAEAQESLDRLHEEMKEADQALDGGQGIFDTLVNGLLPELAIARGMIDKLKDLAEAMGGS
jgi:hypothetical protein